MTLRREKACAAVVLQLIIGAVFLAIQRGTDTAPPPPWLVTPADLRLPLIPASVWIYVSWYLAPLVMLAGDRTQLRLTAGAVAVSFVACAAGWVLLPMSMERPPLAAGDGLSEQMLGIVYAVDPPRNLLPSFHASLAAILVAVPRSSCRVRVALAVWMLAICVSCLLTKQHFVLDVVAGIVVGLGAVRVVEQITAGTVSPAVTRSSSRTETDTLRA